MQGVHLTAKTNFKFGPTVGPFFRLLDEPKEVKSEMLQHA
jgi:hypothetical protein